MKKLGRTSAPRDGGPRRLWRGSAVAIALLMLASIVVFMPAGADASVSSFDQGATRNASVFGDFALCDFNGDGRADVFRSDAAENQWSISYDLGATYVAAQPATVDFDKLMFDDVTGDGRCDVVFGSGGSTPRLRYSSEGRAPWVTSLEYSTARGQLALCDFDGNGTADVFRKASFDDTWRISYDAVSPWTEVRSSTLDFDRMMFTDVDGDGKCDVVYVTGGSDPVLRYSSEAQSGWHSLIGYDGPTNELAMCDFEGDGTSDAIQRRLSDERMLISQDGTRDWVRSKKTATSLEAMLFADVNGDGKCDIVNIKDDGSISYVSAGTSAWTPATTLAPIDVAPAVPEWVNSEITAESTTAFHVEVGWCCLRNYADAIGFKMTIQSQADPNDYSEEYAPNATFTRWDFGSAFPIVQGTTYTITITPLGNGAPDGATLTTTILHDGGGWQVPQPELPPAPEGAAPIEDARVPTAPAGAESETVDTTHVEYPTDVVFDPPPTRDVEAGAGWDCRNAGFERSAGATAAAVRWSSRPAGAVKFSTTAYLRNSTFQHGESLVTTGSPTYVSGLVPLTIYDFVITAFDRNDGVVGVCLVAVATSAAPAPPEPVVCSLSTSPTNPGDDVTVSWDTIPGALKYEVSVSSLQSLRPVRTFTTFFNASTSLAIPDLRAGNRYGIRLDVYDWLGERMASCTLNVDGPPPVASRCGETSLGLNEFGNSAVTVYVDECADGESGYFRVNDLHVTRGFAPEVCPAEERHVRFDLAVWFTRDGSDLVIDRFDHILREGIMAVPIEGQEEAEASSTIRFNGLQAFMKPLGSARRTLTISPFGDPFAGLPLSDYLIANDVDDRLYLWNVALETGGVCDGVLSLFVSGV